MTACSGQKRQRRSLECVALSLADRMITLSDWKQATRMPANPKSMASGDLTITRTASGPFQVGHHGALHDRTCPRPPQSRRTNQPSRSASQRRSARPSTPSSKATQNRLRRPLRRLGSPGLSRELGKPHITAHLGDKVLRNLAVNSAKAGATKVQLLDSANEMVRDRASSFILGLAGISPEAAGAHGGPGGRRGGYHRPLGTADRGWLGHSRSPPSAHPRGRFCGHRDRRDA